MSWKGQSKRHSIASKLGWSRKYRKYNVYVTDRKIKFEKKKDGTHYRYIPRKYKPHISSPEAKIYAPEARSSYLDTFKRHPSIYQSLKKSPDTMILLSSEPIPKGDLWPHTDGIQADYSDGEHVVFVRNPCYIYHNNEKEHRKWLNDLKKKQKLQEGEETFLRREIGQLPYTEDSYKEQWRKLHKKRANIILHEIRHTDKENISLKPSGNNIDKKDYYKLKSELDAERYAIKKLKEEEEPFFELL